MSYSLSCLMRSKGREPVPLCMVQNQSVQKGFSPSADAPSPRGSPASRQAKASTLLHSPPETLSVWGQGFNRMAFGFQGNKNSVPRGPVGVTRSASTSKCTDSQQAIDATGLNEKMTKLGQSIN